MVLDHCYVYTHFEMGDSIICNGLIRNLLKDVTSITLFGKKIHEESMRWMYRDSPNIDFLFFNSYEIANSFVLDKNPRPILKYGFEYISHYEHLKTAGLHFDEMYYHLANIPFSKRWEDFSVLRDVEREKRLFSRTGMKEREYVFVHDEYSTETPHMKSEMIVPNLPIIRPNRNMSENIFDFLYLIENAKEIHCVCSSFKNLIDSMTAVECPLFFHKNRATFGEYPLWISSCKLPWRHVEYF